MLEPYKLLLNWQLLFSTSFRPCVCVCVCVCVCTHVCAWERACVRGVLCVCVVSCCALCYVCVCACACSLNRCVCVCVCAHMYTLLMIQQKKKKEDTSKLNRQRIISYLQFQQFSVQTLSPWSSAPRQSSLPAPASLPLHKIKFNRNIHYQSTSTQCLGTSVTYAHLYTNHYIQPQIQVSFKVKLQSMYAQFLHRIDHYCITSAYAI